MNQNQIVMTRGDSRDLDFSDIVDPSGVAYDLTDVTALTLTVGSGPLFTKVLADFTLDESAGDIAVTIDPADTEDAPDARMAYRYDLQVTLTDGTVNTARRGLFIVTPDVTE